MAEKSRPSLFARLIALLIAGYILLLIIYLAMRLLIADAPWWLALLHNFTPYYFLPLVVFALLSLLMGAKRLLVWCVLLLLIAFIWFIPPTLPKSLPQPEGNQIHMVTMNVYPHNETPEQIVAWVREIKPFIVVLQELNPNIMETISELEDDYDYHIAQPDWRSRAIYSKLPIIESGEVPTLELKHLRVVIDMNGREIALYNVHLDMPADSQVQINAPFLPAFVTQYNESRRNNQIEALIAHLKTEELPYIVAGDFNTSDFSPVYGTLAANMQDAYREAGTGFGFTWPAGEAEELSSDIPLLLRLDYIWHSNSIRTVSIVTGPELGSDHLPLSAVRRSRPLKADVNEQNWQLVTHITL